MTIDHKRRASSVAEIVTASGIVRSMAREGLVLSHGLVEEALTQVDRANLEAAERARYEVKVWNGDAQACPVGQPERWKHGRDEASRRALSAFAAGGVVYFVFRDGDLHLWQPWRADKGHTVQHHMVDKPGHPDHVSDAASRHVDEMVGVEVNRQVTDQAVDAALRLHEQRGVAYHAVARGQ